VSNKNTNLNNQNLQNSNYFVISPVRVGSYAVIDIKYLLENVNTFLIALHKTFKLLNTKGTIVNSCIISVLFFCSFITAHTSRFVYWYSTQSIASEMPSFVLSAMVRIGMEVKSSNKVLGVVEGSISTDLSFNDLLKHFNGLTRDEWNLVLINTPFSSLTYDDHMWHLFQKQFHKTVFPLIDGDDVILNNGYNIVLTYLRMFRSILINDNTCQFTTSKLSDTYSVHIGIYRFTLSHVPDMYHVNQFTLSSIGVASIEQFACFLRIFRPGFFSDPSHKSLFPFTLTPSQLPFELGHVILENAYLKYFSYELTSSNPVNNSPMRENGNKKFNSGKNFNKVSGKKSNPIGSPKAGIRGEKSLNAFDNNTTEFELLDGNINKGSKANYTTQAVDSFNELIIHTCLDGVSRFIFTSTMQEENFIFVRQ
jgi:hypothetical protein